jgi:hypothetical protein
MPTYSAGLDRTWSVLVLIALFVALGGLVGVFKSGSLLHRLKLKTFTLFGLLIVPVIVSLSLFPLVYSTSNLLTQEIATTTFWKHELSTGVFALRVSSYILSFQLVRSIFRFVKRKREIARVRSRRGLAAEQIANFTVDLKPEEAKLWLRGDLALVASLQFAFYLSAVAALWLSAIDARHSLVTTLASWCIFFIADDWTIVSDYTDHFRVPAMTAHKYKIQLFNVTLLVLVPVSLFGSEHVFIPIVLSMVLFLSAATLTLLPWRSAHLVAKS